MVFSDSLDEAISNTLENAPDFRRTRHQLIVLGNGFDLACGLHSSYEAFLGNLPGVVFPTLEGLSGADWAATLRKSGAA